MNLKFSSCYATLALIRKLKHLTPFPVRKQLAECLILSKIDYNDIVSHPIPEYLLRRLQHVQLGLVYTLNLIQTNLIQIKFVDQSTISRRAF